ncbi:spore germination protein [Sulfoacidibacillus thermotolerans]|uniref:Spore germination protein n=1 Tax=Sulfoacidibacillus thermotolerans TaxID=1765684 RepID=A0A2U3D9Z1_SULT2|nr:spore germination protein [Sulfoacidibacillus thermotolerans]PWI58099.1 spore germination protein [Sulfoacidibacillus thermotolerans]
MQMHKLWRWLTVDDSLLDHQFVLTPENKAEHQQIEERAKGQQKVGNARRARHLRLHVKAAYAYYGERHTDQIENGKRGVDVFGKKQITPVTYAALHARAQARAKKRKVNAAWQEKLPTHVQYDIQGNRNIVEHIFHMPKNADIVIRNFRIGGSPHLTAFAVFVDGLADKTIINNHILEPLMLLSTLESHSSGIAAMKWIKENLLPGNQVMELKTWKEVTESILAGSTVVFFEGVATALSVETKGWEHRMVGVSQTEAVVRGPHDAFTENFRANTGLVRSRLRSTKLITEITQIGELASTDIAIMYIDGLANERLIAEVKRRIKSIKVDYMPDSGLLEQFMEDDPISVFPRFLSTERPDRVAYGLTEGQVAIFVGQSPYALLAPVLFWSLLHTSEDAYLRWPFGTFIRSIRMLSLVIGLLLPALYIAVTNYHPEMIPTDLMLAVAASRERVPFPVVFEVLIMEFSLELIREAGIRIPSVIGPTIGIVGALILGQAAVAAGIISPLLIIIVAVTALGSFTMPNYNLSFSIRVLRFAFIVVAAFFGFYGITLGLMVLVMHTVSVRSFGVPLLSPIAPWQKSAPDIIARGKVFTMETRPAAFGAQDTKRQERITRPWSARIEALRKADKRNRT